MPMALRPETTATRADTALIERAMSSDSPITRDDLMPGAGSSSYSVTTGPGRALMISPRTPKSPSTLSSAVAFSWIASTLRGRRALAYLVAFPLHFDFQLVLGQIVFGRGRGGDRAPGHGFAPHEHPAQSCDQ